MSAFESLHRRLWVNRFGRRGSLRAILMVTAYVAMWLSALPATAADTKGGFALPSGLQGLFGNSADAPTDDLTISAAFRATRDGTQGVLSVTAKLGQHWHIYSVTQPDGGPLKTRVLLDATKSFERVGEFQPDAPPSKRKLEVFDVPVEEHTGQVTWSAPVRFAPGTTFETLEIHGKLDGQICQDDAGCVPLSTRDTRFVAKYAGELKAMPTTVAAEQPTTRRTPPLTPAIAAVAARSNPIPTDTSFTAAPAGGYRNGSIHVTWQGRIEPATVAPGGQATLVMDATPDPSWHVYAYAEKDPKAISKPTLFALVVPSTWSAGAVVADREPLSQETGLKVEPVQHYYDRAITWKLPITVPADAKAGKVRVQGMVGYQTCTESRCDSPTAAFFEAELTVAPQSDTSSAAPLRFAPAKYPVVAKYLEAPPAPADQQTSMTVPPADAPPTAAAATGGPISFDLSKIQVDETRDASLAYIVAIAFVGGFILNFMPCVLPVIGLKIVAFVQQAGEHRARILLLNVVYAFGMLTVFWALATLAAAAALKLGSQSLGWGEQFNYPGFTIPLLCVVFVMGLSFLGVWEIPIPGFVGNGAAGELAQKEGLSGAFFKGVITTVLATPCSGPGVATALTWSANKPPLVVYLVFTSMGLGMALPYLLIGAFPRLIRFIPRPGAWMDTFKQLMGFVLLGTVVYMFGLLPNDYMVATLALMFSLWASCWWIGRVPVTAPSTKKLTAWLGAATLSAVVGWLAFGYQVRRAHELPWQDYSLAALDEHVKANRTVLVDFTAKWCVTCKLLERSVLNTEPVRQLVDKNEVVTLVADWSDQNEEVSEMLRALGSTQVPVIAIFPANDPYHPIKLAGGYTRRTLLQKIQAAGPSVMPRLAGDQTATAR